MTNVTIKVKDGATGQMIKSRKYHADFGMHRNSMTGACMCTKPCCQSESGCCCRTCSGVGHVNCYNARVRDSARRLVICHGPTHLPSGLSW